jgi:hypothetical protein
MYDARVSKEVALEEILPETWRRWMIRGSDGNCQFAALAEDEAGARKALLKHVVEDGGYYTQEKLAAWFAAGQPVELDTYAKAPKMVDLDEIMKPLGRVEAAEAAPSMALVQASVPLVPEARQEEQQNQ